MTKWDMDDKDLNVGTLYCIGRNYAAHAAEMGSALPEDPLVFIKPPNAYMPSGSTIRLPLWSSNIHHEVELVVVIGRTVDEVKEDEAMSVVAGLAIGLDLTARDVQARAKKNGEPWSVAKGWKGAAPVSKVVPIDRCGEGPWRLSLELNGETRQSGSTRMMERSIPSLVAYVSSIFGLRAGDAIFTGTPEGVGPVQRGERAIARLQDLATLDVRFA